MKPKRNELSPVATWATLGVATIVAVGWCLSARWGLVRSTSAAVEVLGRFGFGLLTLAFLTVPFALAALLVWRTATWLVRHARGILTMPHRPRRATCWRARFSGARDRAPPKPRRWAY